MTGKLFVLVALVVAALAIGGGIASATPSGKLDSQVIGNVRIDASGPTVGYPASGSLPVLRVGHS